VGSPIVAFLWLGIARDFGGRWPPRSPATAHRGDRARKALTPHLPTGKHRKKQIEHDLESPAFDEATALHSEQAGGGIPHRGIVGDRAARHRGDGL